MTIPGRKTPGERIQFARLLAGTSRKELASQLQISNRCLQNIEAGKKQPTQELLLSVGRYLGISVEWILQGGQALPPQNICHEKPEKTWRITLSVTGKCTRQSAMVCITTPSDETREDICQAMQDAYDELVTQNLNPDYSLLLTSVCWHHPGWHWDDMPTDIEMQFIS